MALCRKGIHSGRQQAFGRQGVRMAAVAHAKDGGQHYGLRRQHNGQSRPAADDERQGLPLAEQRRRPDTTDGYKPDGYDGANADRNRTILCKQRLAERIATGSNTATPYAISEKHLRWPALPLFDTQACRQRVCRVDCRPAAVARPAAS